ncbi:MAG: hypothetical protein ACP5NQ_00375 [Vulcanisaeta sp.]
MMTLLPIPSEEDVRFIYDPHNSVGEIMSYVDAVANNSSGAGVILGNYGFGKTHMMLHVTYLTRSRYDGAVTIYINTPGQGFMTLYRAFMNSVMDLLKELTGFLEVPLSTAVGLLSSGGEDGEYARQWLLGEPVPQNFRLKHGLGSRINEELGLRVMLSVMRGLVRAGRGPILILLDELEDVITLGIMRRLQYLSLLRNLVDNLPAKSLFLASSTPAGWNEVANTYPALARRLSSFIIYLKPFTLEESVEFVRSIIKWRGLGITLSEDSIKVLHEFTEGNPGEIVKALSLIHAVFRDREVRPEDVKALLSRYV